MTLVVSDDVSSCWAPGAQLVVTTQTLAPDDGQRVTVASIDSGVAGSARLRLAAPVSRPATEAADGPVFASEVALLSRNVIVDGGGATDGSVPGGHLMVFHTPDREQLLQGVAFVGMGQRGRLGRYPVHMHLNGNMQGTRVAKNAILGSQQRCIVVHGSNSVTVEGNVAYDTFGHCYLLEDGGEELNTFRGNLGAWTRAMPRADLIRGEESDDSPATFWVTNPNNTYADNVAAGSDFAGFWLELPRSPRTPGAAYGRAGHGRRASRTTRR